MTKKTKTKKLELSAPFALLQSAFRLYFKKGNVLYLVAVAAVNFAISLPLGLALGYILFGKVGQVPVGEFALDYDRILDSLGLLILTFILLVIVSAWTKTATIIAITGVVAKNQKKLVATYVLAAKKSIKYLFGSLLYVALVSIGLVLLVIPGMLFYVWFVFALFLVVLSDKSIWQSFKESKRLVVGNFWQVVYSLIVFNLFFLVVNYVFSSIDYLSMVLVLFSTFYILPLYLLFKKLQS